MKISLFGGLCVGAVNILVSAAAFAQSATPANQSTAPANQPTTAADQDGLAEITVTAQRRSENLERTPVAIAVLSSDALVKQDIATQSDLQNVVPGLQVRESLNSNQVNYAVRGQSVAAFSSSTPAVLPYVNEVQVSGPGGSSAFYDLQSIQVLKGPQGTLFGRNATGGAVLITTTKPDDKFGGYIDVEVGGYNEKKFDGALNIPIVGDVVLARVAGFYQKRDGFQYNLFSGTTVGDVDRYGGRASLTVKFSDRLKNDLVVDYLHSGGSSSVLVVHSVSPVSANEPPVPANILFTPSLDTAIGVPGAWAAYLAANPKVPPGGLFAAVAQQNARGPFTVDVNASAAYKANNTLISNITTFDIADNMQFKNVLGYNNLRSRAGDDADGSPYGINGTATGQTYGFDNADSQFSEEPQLIGKALDGNLSYVSGGYFAFDRYTVDLYTEYVNLTPIIQPIRHSHDTLNRDKSYAGYAQGSYDLSSATGIQGFSASAGLRFTNETVSMQQEPPSLFFTKPVNPLYHNFLQHSWNKVSWQFGLQEQLNSNLMLYAVTRRSFRSGGFNGEEPPVAGFGNEGGSGFDAETATDGELGVKFQGSLASMPTRLNVAAFLGSIKNTQEVVFTNVAGSNASSVTVNVPKSRISGLEAEGEIDPTRWLKVGASVAYTNAVFADSTVTVPSTPAPTTVDFGPYPDTPKWSGSVFSEVTVPVTANISASVRGQLYDQTITYFSATNNTLTPGTELSGYAVANFTLSVEDSKAGWWAGVIIKNAFNRVYYVGGLAGANLYATNAVSPGDPRTVVGEVRYKF
jgi:iron complex outermembrane recepter protein